MSPRSRRNATKKGKGAKAPSFLARLEVIERYLQDDPRGLVVHHGVADGERNPTVGPKVTAPPIKPRLEALIDRAASLNSRLDQLSHAIVGDGAPSEAGASSPAPFAIPDQLEALENLLLRASERLDGISNRF